MPIGDFTVHPEAPGKTTPSMTMRQAYKLAALHKLAHSEPSDHGTRQIALDCGAIADAMLAEDEEHAKK